MDIAFVDLKKQYTSIQDEIDSTIQKVITESAFVGGKYVQQFEQEFARFCNAQYCVGVANIRRSFFQIEDSCYASWKTASIDRSGKTFFIFAMVERAGLGLFEDSSRW